MEGIDIPNPNHFASIGSTGGTISILSAQLLANSDFLTGAFPAEYGNALSGVFDLSLRKGNNEKREYSFDAGLLGLGIAAEGPFNSSYSGSYLVNYRYSTLAVLNKIGFHLYSGVSNFQDFSYNINLPSKFGNFTLFGFEGLSSNVSNPVLDSNAWKEFGENLRYGEKFISNTGISGITHFISLGASTSLKSAIAYSYEEEKNINNYVQNDYSEKNISGDSYVTRKLQINSVLNHKFSFISEGRLGITSNFMFYDFNKYQSTDIQTMPNTILDGENSTETLQAFGEWRFRPLKSVTFVSGIHYLFLALNQSSSVEPRISVKWNITNKSNLAIGYGTHSQIQPLGTYFALSKNDLGNNEFPNINLGLTKARHYILSMEHNFNRELNFKVELYYQKLFNVPVSIKDSTVSILNIDENYITDPLINKGKGVNYGVEFSLDKNLSNHLYCLLTTSLFQSKFKALDNIERNTRFNQNFINSLTLGKEFLSADKKKIFALNIKIINTGGIRDTPVDVDKSMQLGFVNYVESQAYSLQYPMYFRADLRLSMKWNRLKRTNTLSLDVQNLTNQSNIKNEIFIVSTGAFYNQYQNPLIPVLNYKVEF